MKLSTSATEAGPQITDKTMLDKFGIASNLFNFRQKSINYSKLFSRKIKMFNARPNLLKSDGDGRGQVVQKILHSKFEQPCPSFIPSIPAHQLSKPCHSIIAMLPKLRCKWDVEEVGGRLGTEDVEGIGD